VALRFADPDLLRLVNRRPLPPDADPSRPGVFILFRRDGLVVKERHGSIAETPAGKCVAENGAAGRLLNLPEAEVASKIKAYEGEHVILGYRTILNEEKLGLDLVRAVIEVESRPNEGAF